MSSRTCYVEGCNQRSFSRPAELKRHEEEYHGPMRYCPYLECNWKGTKRLSRYKDHIAKHHDTPPVLVLEVPEDFSAYAASNKDNKNGNYNPPSSKHPDHPSTTSNEVLGPSTHQIYPSVTMQAPYPSSSTAYPISQAPSPYKPLPPTPKAPYYIFGSGVYFNSSEMGGDQADLALVNPQQFSGQDEDWSETFHYDPSY